MNALVLKWKKKKRENDIIIMLFSYFYYNVNHICSKKDTLH